MYLCVRPGYTAERETNAPSSGDEGGAVRIDAVNAVIGAAGLTAEDNHVARS